MLRKINLADPDNTDISFKVTPFPDGQQQVVLMESVSNCSIEIVSRLNNWRNLELITCTVADLRRMGIKEISLYAPYILGARSDRKFEKGGNNYLKDVISPAVNILKLDKITVLDPHSDCLEMGLDNLEIENNVKFAGWAIQDIIKETILGGGKESDICVISPDGGSRKKIYDTLQGIGFEGELILAEKHRDVKTGKLTGFTVPLTDAQKGKPLVIIDDICDGGGTFIGEAEVADKNGHAAAKYLVCTHSILSKGTADLTKHFDGMYTTNSYKDITDPFVKVLNIFT